MFKSAALATFFLIFFIGKAQEVSLPADLRQHTLTQFNASLFNPAFSLDRNNPQSVAFWTRWQWQNIDADPTTLFLNYTRGLNENSAAGIGFFQHNTGIYFNTGVAANYAYQFEFNRLIKLSVGANVFGFQQQIADTRFPVNPIPGIPQSTPTDDFILQVAPGFNLQVENFSLSLASENLIDYNFTDKEANTANSDKSFMGMGSYDFPIMASDSTAYLRPSIYLRTIPKQPNQIGLNVLFSTRKFWVQSGYNNFYGISVGGGGTILERFSLGAIVEFGTSGSLNSKDPSFELVASYFIGKPEERRPLVASGILDEMQQVVLLGDEITNEQIRAELEKAEKLSNQKEEKIPEIEEKEESEIPVENTIDDETLDEISETVDKEETKESKKAARKLAAEKKAIEKQKRKDSIATLKREKEALELAKKLEEDKAREEAEALRRTEELKAEEAKKALEREEAEKLKEQEKQEALQKANDVAAEEELQRKIQQRKLDSIADARKLAAVKAAQELEEKRKQDAIEEARKKEAIARAEEAKRQKQLDSIAMVNKAKAEAAKKAAEEAEVATEAPEVSKPEVVKPQAGEKYEEVATEDGLEPGYYLIVNVFGTKKYFDAFMGDLRNKGIQPKSFYRSSNKYNYAYLERYRTIREARQARDSRFNGKYNGKTWIFRVVGK